MAIEEYGFQPILEGTLLFLGQVGAILTTSPDSYRPETLPQWVHNKNTTDLQTEKPDLLQSLELSRQNHLERTHKLSVVAGPLLASMTFEGDLRLDLISAMKTGMTGNYIPNDKLEEFTSNDNFERAIRDISSEFSAPPDERELLANKLLRDCRVLVSIFVHGQLSKSLLEALVRNGITDKSLPLPSECFEWLEGRNHLNFYKCTYASQWQFKAANFHEIGQRQKLDEKTIVPFLSKKWEGKGGFSTVWKVRLEASHQSVYSLPGDKNPELALKVIEGRKRNSTAFQNERLMLEGLQGVSHRHIIRLLGTYEQGEDCHFLFPFADGDLMWLMTNRPDVRKSKAIVPWVMAQMKGICDALCKVHRQTKETTAHLDRHKFEKAAGHLKPSHQQGTGYHHDIKPQNILYFSQSRISLDGLESGTVPELGILQLADFGVGKFRRLQSGSGTRTWRGTPTYAAPESLQDFEDSQNSHKISRPYDIWSFGCVLLEVLVWVVLGADELHAFKAQRSQPAPGERSGYRTDAFCYTTESGGCGLIKPKVVSYMQKLREHHRLSSADLSLSKLLDLIEQTLKIDPMDRMNAMALMEELDRISELAEKGPRYEFVDEEVSPNASSTSDNSEFQTDSSVPTVEIIVHPASQ